MSDPAKDDEEARRLAPLRPTVPLRKEVAGAWLFAGSCAAMAAGLFAALDTRRQSMTAPDTSTARVSGDGFVDPPPLVLPRSIPVPVAPVPAPAPAVVAEPLPPPPRPVVASPPPSPLPPPPPLPRRGERSAPVMDGRLNEPALVYDQSAPAPAPAEGAGGKPGAVAMAGGDAAVQATLIRGRSTVIAQGSLIAATLETPIDSTRAGFARAIVASDARSFDGSRILIPRGSRLIGEYTADVQSGQKRVLVTWTRLIRPDGVAIRLGSPAADRLGQAGIPGQVDTHFLARFTSAVLQTALTIGTNIASRPSRGSVIVGVPSQTSGAIGQILSPGRNLRPTIRVRQGAPITVFVGRDLDFSGVTPRS